MEWYSAKKDDDVKPPSVDGRWVLTNGVLKEWSGDTSVVLSPIVNEDDGKQVAIGHYAMCDAKTAEDAVASAVTAYDHGRGLWPSLKPWDRIKHVQKFAQAMKEKREELVNILMWEICKNRSDSEKEVDRTIDYILQTINELTKLENATNGVDIEGGIAHQVKRSPLGVALVCGPFNYPLNEFCTLFIPAIIMGNTCIIKTPRTGGLVHIPLLEAYRDCFPPGAVSVIHGSGRAIFTPIMKSGAVNILAFIGSNSAAQQLHMAHPKPFSVRLALGLDAKNCAIVTSKADLDVAAPEIVLGALSFNGQRCTAIKLIFAHDSIADALVARLAASIDKLVIGLPWKKGAQITPLAEPGKPEFLQKLIADAVSKGAKVVNARGDQVYHTVLTPTLLYPCTPAMRVVQEEQFGPVVPVVRYSDLKEIEDYMIATQYGQQAALFTSDSTEVPRIIDFLAHHVTRININSQCQRGPDSMPFGGRKVSATGTLSLFDALRTMSIRVAVATKHTSENARIFTEVFQDHKSNLLSSDVIISKF